MARFWRVCGFSLVEVIIAVGIFAGAVAGIIGLLPALTRQATESADLLVAQRMPAAVASEFRRAVAGGSLTGLASQIKTMGTTPTLQLVATRDGGQLQLAAGSTIAAAEQYFLIEAWQFSTAPLAFDSSSGAVLAVFVRVSWPYRLPGSDVGSPVTTPEADRSQFTFTVAINR